VNFRYVISRLIWLSTLLNAFAPFCATTPPGALRGDRAGARSPATPFPLYSPARLA